MNIKYMKKKQMNWIIGMVEMAGALIMMNPFVINKILYNILDITKQINSILSFGCDTDYDLQAIIEQYKEQAKEMLENE